MNDSHDLKQRTTKLILPNQIIKFIALLHQQAKPSQKQEPATFHPH